jgi:hypothetical protein
VAKEARGSAAHRLLNRHQASRAPTAIPRAARQGCCPARAAAPQGKRQQRQQGHRAIASQHGDRPKGHHDGAHQGARRKHAPLAGASGSVLKSMVFR